MNQLNIMEEIRKCKEELGGGASFSKRENKRLR
jgi:hypothetical protein